MSTDILDGLDMPEAEASTPQPQAPEPKVDPSPPSEQPRAKDGTFKGEGKTEAKQPEASKEPEKSKDKEDVVPIARHLEERNRHRAEIDQLRKEHAALQAELEGLKKPKEAPPPEPDFTNDPKGYVDTKLAAALKQLETGVAEGKKTAEQAQQESAFLRFQHQLSTTEQQFVAQNPDYYDSLKHLRELRFQELAILNPGVEPQQIIDAIKREEVQLAWQHIAAGRDPHALAYQLAKTRGYTKKEAPPANGVLPHVPKTPQLPPDQTLGSGSGTPNAGETFLDDDEVFDKAFNEMFGRKRA